MTESSYPHQYNVGDAVLANINGRQVPGVVAESREGQVKVHLASAWVDDMGQESNEAWLSPDQLDVYIEQETGGHQALPG